MGIVFRCCRLQVTGCKLQVVNKLQVIYIRQFSKFKILYSLFLVSPTATATAAANIVTSSPHFTYTWDYTFPLP